MTAAERAIRALGVDLPPHDMALAMRGVEDDIAAAARLRAWLAAQTKAPQND
jgi:hypothetical protein